MDEKKPTRRRPRWPVVRDAPPASGQRADGGTPRQQDEVASARTTVQPAAAGLRTASPAHDPLVGSARVAGTSRLISVGFRRPPSDAAARVAVGADRSLPAGTTEEPGPVSFRRPPIAAAGQLGDLNRSVSWLVRYPSLVQIPVDDDQQRLHPDPAGLDRSESRPARDAALLPGQRAAPEAQPAPEPGSPAGEQAAVTEQPGGRRFLRSGRRRVVLVTTLILILLIAGGAALPYSLRHGRNQGSGSTTPSAASGPGSDATAVTTEAVQWISRQVSREAIVACDPSTCSALATRGTPRANLLVLRAATSKVNAGVVVVTPALRRQFGSRLNSVLAPSVIAGFGSGADRVTVQVTASDGLAAYDKALREDVASRKVAGTQLLSNRRIELTAEARRQLAAGQVDSRILLMLPVLAVTYPIQVLAFGDRGPEASPGEPLCSVELSGSGDVAGITSTSYTNWLENAVRTQTRGSAGSVTVELRGSRPQVRVEFSRPSPLGLLKKR